MKWISRILAMFMTFILICFLFGCDQISGLSGQTEGNTEKGDDEYMLYIRSVDEYRTYIEKKTKPEGFVSYEMLSDIGEFYLFVPFDMNGVIYQYSYRLKTDDGFIDIDISYGQDDTSEIIYLQSPPSEGFAKTAQFKHVAASYKDIIYIYPESGKLSAMRIVSSNMTLTISFGGEARCFSEFNFEHDNLVTCLLSGNEDNVDIVSHYLTERSEE